MITIFCTPKNFEGIFDVIQKNAIRSWRKVSSEIEIIIFGDSFGAKEIASEVNGIYYPKIKCSKNGVPFLSDLFDKANKISVNDTLMFINADIIIPKNIFDPIKIIRNQFQNFLSVGSRWDLDVDQSINFEKEDIVKLFWEKANNYSVRSSPAAIDYFIFNKNSIKKIPDFVIGRPGYDNWLLWYARRNLIPLIDLSNEIRVIHQNHHFNFHNIKQDPKIYYEEDGLNNRKIHGNKVLNLLDANYELINGMINKKKSKEWFDRNLRSLPQIFPEISFVLKLYRKIYRKYLI
ncbi:MAG: hypothetical protein CMG55_08795 [Candidatus Marinimicrobia bacterium]|nr:hypothetical protein [Candidatus Neomarinimicrobiota bacterium]|tara:strand:+ start:129 stop:1001 length:873 start_codon:yes stop_codon:yes gene_type:complete